MYLIKVMGGVPSTAYNFCRRMILRYNIQNRALKFLEKDRLPPAPKFNIPTHCKPKDVQGTSLKHIHDKNEELNQFLKKVYLTSTSKVIGTPSKRPLPKKENERLKKAMFYEPETPAPGHVTLTRVIDILLKTQDENTFLSPSQVAKEFNLDRKDTANLIAYYSLFRLEKFDFMNAVEKKEQESKLIESSPFKSTSKRIAAE